ASLAAIIVELGTTPGGTREPLRLVLATITIVLSWAFIHTIFALHYAHEYHAEHRKHRGGLEFPGEGAPDYWDFVYFSFVIGMAAQTADVAVTSKTIRPTVAAPGLVSFVFNAPLLALPPNNAPPAVWFECRRGPGRSHARHHRNHAAAAGRAGGGGDRGEAPRHRTLHSARDRRHRARARSRTAARRARAGVRAPGAAAAADLFRRRVDELARVPLQPAADRAGRLRLRGVHHLCGCRHRALAHRPAVAGGLPARRPRGAARRG